MFNFDFKVVKQYRHITSISEEDPIGSFFVYFLPLNHWGKKGSCTNLWIHQNTTIEQTANQNWEYPPLIYRYSTWTQRHYCDN